MSEPLSLESPLTVDRKQCAVWTDQVVKIHGTEPATVIALNSISVGFSAGELTCITGPSGSGKSTLLHCLAGLDRPTSGRIVLAGIELSELSERHLTRIRRDKVGFVFQAFNLVPTLNAQENITLPLDIAGGKIDRAWMSELIEVLGIGDRLRHRPAQLSGGEQQRVAVARALLSRPDVIFADEPTGNLDMHAGHDLLSLIVDAVKRYGQTVVMVTHDPAVAAHSDRVVFLVDGQVVSQLNEPTVATVHEKMQMLWGV